MIPSTPSSETHIAQIEIENEITTTETKNPTNNNVISVKYSEILRQENARECKKDSEAVNNNATFVNAQVCGKWFTSTNVYKIEMGDSNIKKKGRKSKKKKSMFYPTDYWVQIQDSAASPLNYTPDRNEFIAKVFSIVLFMLLITAAFVGFVRSSEDMIELFVDTGVGKTLMLTGAGGMAALSCLIMCCPYMRLFPCNLIMLIVAVVCMSLITAYITALHRTEVIFFALISTAVTVFACLLLAMTSFDFTKFLLYVFAVIIAFTAVSLLALIASFALGIVYKPLQVVLLFVGTLLNVIMLVMELQMIIGGKAVSLNEDEYMFGAYMLYTSIVNLFLKMVEISGLFLDMDLDED